MHVLRGMKDVHTKSHIKNVCSQNLSTGSVLKILTKDISVMRWSNESIEGETLTEGYAEPLMVHM